MRIKTWGFFEHPKEVQRLGSFNLRLCFFLSFFSVFQSSKANANNPTMGHLGNVLSVTLVVSSFSNPLCAMSCSTVNGDSQIGHENEPQINNENDNKNDDDNARSRDVAELERKLLSNLIQTPENPPENLDLDVEAISSGQRPKSKSAWMKDLRVFLSRNISNGVPVAESRSVKRLFFYRRGSPPTEVKFIVVPAAASADGLVTVKITSLSKEEWADQFRFDLNYWPLRAEALGMFKTHRFNQYRYSFPEPVDGQFEAAAFSPTSLAQLMDIVKISLPDLGDYLIQVRELTQISEIQQTCITNDLYLHGTTFNFFFRIRGEALVFVKAVQKAFGEDPQRGTARRKRRRKNLRKNEDLF
ncbi:MAG: hypothetical protein C5B49_03980 [Bdellovibrio sp.]|nr:MAG: hypothetical protein C5B49_03980 [Bdellovibrio sp.]